MTATLFSPYGVLHFSTSHKRADASRKRTAVCLIPRLSAYGRFDCICNPFPVNRFSKIFFSHPDNTDSRQYGHKIVAPRVSAITGAIARVDCTVSFEWLSSSHPSPPHYPPLPLPSPPHRSLLAPNLWPSEIWDIEEDTVMAGRSCSKHGLHIQGFCDVRSLQEHGFDAQLSIGNLSTSEAFSWKKEEGFRSVSSDFSQVVCAVVADYDSDFRQFKT